MASTMSLQEPDPALALTKRWVFLLSRSWGSAPDPEVCLKGCRGGADGGHRTRTPNPPCTLLTATASGVRSSSKEIAATTGSGYDTPSRS